MRAARIHEYGPPEVLRVEEAARPTPGPDDLLVRVHAAAVNPVDCKMRAGAQRAVVRRKLPTVLGLDVSGVVEAVGDKVSGFAVGDAVCASPNHKRDGTYAEYCLVAAREAAKKPKRLSHAEAASLPLVGLTAIDSLIDGMDVQPGEKVLIHAGSGGVGTVAIQMARHLGAHVATTCSDRNVELVSRLGAHEVIDYTRADFTDALSDYDAAIDALGGEVQRRTLAVLRRGGRLSSLVSGMPEATKRYGPYLGVLAVAGGLLGSHLRARLRGVKFHMALRKCDGERLATLLSWVESGAIEPVIDRVFPLEDIVEAHRYQETGRARGKVVIAVRDET